MGVGKPYFNIFLVLFKPNSFLILQFFLVVFKEEYVNVKFIKKALLNEEGILTFNISIITIQ